MWLRIFLKILFVIFNGMMEPAFCQKNFRILVKHNLKNNTNHIFVENFYDEDILTKTITYNDDNVIYSIDTFIYKNVDNLNFLSDLKNDISYGTVEIDSGSFTKTTKVFRNGIKRSHFKEIYSRSWNLEKVFDILRTAHSVNYKYENEKLTEVRFYSNDKNYRTFNFFYNENGLSKIINNSLESSNFEIWNFIYDGSYINVFKNVKEGDQKLRLSKKEIYKIDKNKELQIDERNVLLLCEGPVFKDSIIDEVYYDDIGGIGMRVHYYYDDAGALKRVETFNRNEKLIELDEYFY